MQTDASRFADHLEAGEEVRWVGRPSTTGVRRGARLAQRFAWFASIFGIGLWIGVVFLRPAPVWFVFWTIVLLGYPVLSFLIPWADRRHRARTRYAVTNQRALVDIGGSVEAFPVIPSRFAIVEEADDLRTVVISERLHGWQINRQHLRPIAFEMLTIDDALACRHALAPLLGHDGPRH